MVTPPYATQFSVRRLRSRTGAKGGDCRQAPLLGLIPFFLYSFRKRVMSQLQMRSLQTRSITQPPRFGGPGYFLYLVG